MVVHAALIEKLLQEILKIRRVWLGKDDLRNAGRAIRVASQSRTIDFGRCHDLAGEESSVRRAKVPGEGERKRGASFGAIHRLKATLEAHHVARRHGRLLKGSVVRFGVLAAHDEVREALDVAPEPIGSVALDEGIPR